MRADPISRGIAFLFDAIPVSVVILVLGRRPQGAPLAACLALMYWLLRDVTGASPGKRLFGLAVTGEAGQRAPLRALVLRNVTVALAPLGVIGSEAGLGFLTPLGGAAILLEEIVLLAAKRRLGDMLAGTTVAVARQREGSHPGAT